MVPFPFPPVEVAFAFNPADVVDPTWVEDETECRSVVLSENTDETLSFPFALPSSSSPGAKMIGVAPNNLPSFLELFNSLARSLEFMNDVYFEGGGDPVFGEAVGEGEPTTFWCLLRISPGTEDGAEPE